MRKPPSRRFFILSKNCVIRCDDRAAGECEGAKGPPRMELMPQKWLKSAIFSILRNSKCVGQIAKKSRRDFFDNQERLRQIAAAVLDQFSIFFPKKAATACASL